MRPDEERLLQVLEYTGQPCLPDEVDENCTPVWIYAIAKVMMMNLSTGYAVVRDHFGDTPTIEKIFGTGAVAKIVSIYPYKFLDKKYIPEIKTAKEANAFIAKVYHLNATPNYKMIEATSIILDYAASCQLSDEKKKQNNNDLRETEQN